MNFDTLLGVYHYCNAWHTGQGSREYRVLSRVSRVFTPSRSEEYLETLARPEYEAARAVYVALVKSKKRFNFPNESGYSNCVCCSFPIMVDDITAESGVTMCDDCAENDCNPREACNCEESEEV